MSEQPPTASGTASAESGADEQDQRQIVARYGRMGHIGLFRHDVDPPPKPGENVVLRTERGAELGEVLASVDEGPGRRVGSDLLESYIVACGSDYPFYRRGRVLRAATAQDFNDQLHLDKSALEEAAFCRQQVADLGLEMKVVAVEHLLGGERIVFYFQADHRVDFRELVRRLAGQYHTRVEMRQVGARDEARLVADSERCGRRCCCQQFLTFLKPVSMRMAQTQRATLDPSKISGRCGRLMCCLRYEDAMYTELQAALPKKGIWVRTADGTVGKIAEVQALTQLVRLVLPDRSQLVVPNDEIAERDVPEPPAPEMVHRLRERQRPPPAKAAPPPQPEPPPPPELGEEELLPEEAPAADAPPQAEQAAEKTQKPRRKKRRRGGRGKAKGKPPSAPKRPAGHPEALSIPAKLPGQDGAARPDSSPKPASGSRRKRRRRKPKRGRGQGGQPDRPKPTP